MSSSLLLHNTKKTNDNDVDTNGIDDIFSYMCSLAVAKCAKKSEKKKASCGGAAMRKRLLIKNFVAQMLDQERTQNGREQLSREVNIPSGNSKKSFSNKPIQTVINEDDMDEDIEEEYEEDVEFSTSDLDRNSGNYRASLKNNDEESDLEDDEEQSERDGFERKEERRGTVSPLLPDISTFNVERDVSSSFNSMVTANSNSYLLNDSICVEDDDDNESDLFTLERSPSTPLYYEDGAFGRSYRHVVDDYQSQTVNIVGSTASSEFYPQCGGVAGDHHHHGFMISSATVIGESHRCHQTNDDQQLPENFMDDDVSNESSITTTTTYAELRTTTTTNTTTIMANAHNFSTHNDNHDDEVNDYTSDLMGNDKADNDALCTVGAPDEEDKANRAVVPNDDDNEDRESAVSAFVDLINMAPPPPNSIKLLMTSDFRTEALLHDGFGTIHHRHITDLDTQLTTICEDETETGDQFVLGRDHHLHSHHHHHMASDSNLSSTNSLFIDYDSASTLSTLIGHNNNGGHYSTNSIMASLSPVSGTPSLFGNNGRSPRKRLIAVADGSGLSSTQFFATSPKRIKL